MSTKPLKYFTYVASAFMLFAVGLNLLFGVFIPGLLPFSFATVALGVSSLYGIRYWFRRQRDDLVTAILSVLVLVCGIVYGIIQLIG